MCDLSDPRILETYTAVIEDEPTNWFILGYNDTRDVISLYSKGTEGLSEFRNNLSDEVLYGFVRVDDRFILITWVSEQVSGVRRARALVHSRSVAALLKAHHAQLTASTANDLSDANIRTRLKLGDSQIPRRSSSSHKRASSSSRRQSEQTPVTPTAPELPQTPQQDEFVEASETLPVETPTAVTPEQGVTDEQRQQQQQEQEEQQRLQLAKQKEQEELSRQLAEEKKRAEEVAATVAAAAAAEQEAKRIAAEVQANEKKLEAERIQRDMAEAQRIEEEKRMLQQRLLEAEKNKDVILSGYVSVQPSTSPFWRRRYFTIKGKSMAFYRDELNTTPITILDLNNVTRLNNVNVDIETFVPNAFVLETQQNGSYQLFADDRKGLETILTALQTVI